MAMTKTSELLITSAPLAPALALFFTWLSSPLGLTPVAWAIACLSAFIAALVVYGFLPRFKLPGLPGPTPHWLIGNLPEYMRYQPHEMHRKFTAAYGAIYKYAFGTQVVAIVTSPEFIKTVGLDSKTFRDRAGPMPYWEPRETSMGMLMSRGKYWESARSAVVPMFHTERLKQFNSLMNTAADAVVEALAKHTNSDMPVRITNYFKQLTLQVIGTSAFGVDFAKDASAQPLAEATAKIIDSSAVARGGNLVLLALLVCRPIGGALMLLNRMLPWTTAHAANLARLFVLSKSGEVVRQRAADANSGSKFDFLFLLLRGHNKAADRPFSEAEIRAQAFEFLQAGFETTANTLAFAVDLLSRHPVVEAKLLAEIDAAGRNSPVTYEDIESKYPYVDCVIKETLRLYPPAPIVMRWAETDTTIGKYHIPKGTSVFVPIYAVQRNPQNFPDPDTFMPERFLPGKEVIPYTWIPFGVGARMCIGWRFAMQEAKLTLVRLYQQYTFKLVSDTPLEVQASFVLKPKGPIDVLIKSR